MLPPKLLWRDPRPIPRGNRQDVPIVIEVLSGPDYYEPTEQDDCPDFEDVCLSHDRPRWRHGRGWCDGEGPHVVALRCSEHGYENRDVQPIMHRFPKGFIPRLTATRLAEVELEIYPEGRRLIFRVLPHAFDFASRNGARPRTAYRSPRASGPGPASGLGPGGYASQRSDGAVWLIG